MSMPISSGHILNVKPALGIDRQFVYWRESFCSEWPCENILEGNEINGEHWQI